MKEKLFAVVKKVIRGAAVLSSESTSWSGLISPRHPKHSSNLTKRSEVW